MKEKFLLRFILFICVSLKTTLLLAQPRTLPIPSGIEEIDNLSKKALDLVVDNKALNFPIALRLADSIKHLATLRESYRAECTSYGNIATIFKLNHNYDFARQYAQKAIDVARRNGDSTFSLPQAYRLMGSCYMGQLNWQKALEYYFRALKLYEQSKDIVQQSLILSEIGVVYHRSKDIEKAKKYYISALEKLGDRDKNWEIFFRNRLSTAYLATSKFDSSIMEANKAINLLNNVKNPWMMSLVKFNIAGAYFEKGKLDSALIVNKEVIELAKRDSQETGAYLAGLAQIFEAQGRNEEAEKTYFEAISESERRFDVYAELDSRQALTDFYKKTGQLEKANKESLKLTDLKDSVFSKDKAIAVQELEYKYENDKKETEIVNLKSKNTLKNWLAIAGGVATIFAFVMLWNFRRNSKLTKALLLQKQKTLEQEKENALIEKELETEHKEKALLNEKLKEEENRRLQNEMAITNRELATITLYVQEKNKVFEDLQNQLNATIAKTEGQGKSELQNISKTIRQSISFESDWDKIKLHFEKVHPEFFQKLQAGFPHLTQNELKHCAYIRMNMNNKETANLMNIDANSVKMNRYRIKKKMNLAPEDDLNAIIQQL